MATKKTSGSKRSSSGSDPKSKRIVKGKMQNTMHEFKHGQLDSGRSGKKVKNPKQAIAIGLSEARRSGANIPPDPNAKKRSAKKATAKKASKNTAAKKTPAKKSAAKRATTKSSGTRTTKKATKKTAAKRPAARKR